MRSIIYSSTSSLLILVVLEVFVELFMNRTFAIPEFMVPSLQSYYSMYDRHIIQFDPTYAHYDPDLFYLLNKGNFNYSNREFSTVYKINSEGLRDKESSLENPEIIVLGDSYAMGWGVDQQYTFAEIVENNSNKKVLNAAISSYGTIRELKLLERLDLDSLKWLIIQYCSNDYTENLNYKENGNTLEISSIQEYNSILLKHAMDRKYYPFKHLISICKIIGRKLWTSINGEKRKNDSERTRTEREALINVLKSELPVSNSFQIILFELSGRNSAPSALDDTLMQLINLDTVLSHKSIHLMSIEDKLTPEDYFILDEHINSSGHEKVADELLKLIHQ